MTDQQAKSEIDWLAVSRLIDAHNRAKQLGYVPGTSNWGAMLLSAIAQPVQPDIASFIQSVTDPENQPVQPVLPTEEAHSCSYNCMRPQCLQAQAM